VVIADVEPPASLELPRLSSWSTPADALTGANATPSHVLAAIGGAGEAIIHAHGLVDQLDASFLALSPDASGAYTLTTRDVRAAAFSTSPLVILAACRASHAAPVLHQPWSLPAAFVFAGASAVVASTAPIPDADANAFFDDFTRRVRSGQSAAVALRDSRNAWLGQGRGEWVRDLIVFD
jgi:CHAT domain-containing protein